MPGKPQVSATRLANILDALSRYPEFKGRVLLQPNGGIEIDTCTDVNIISENEAESPSDLTDKELAVFSSTA